METLPVIINNYTEEAKKVFNALDITPATREDYKARIGLFLNFITSTGLSNDSFLEFKKYLANRTDYTTATKNKYLATAKVLLKELNRQGRLPADITQNIKTFTQNKKHTKEGLKEEEIKTVIKYLNTLKETPHNAKLRAIITLLTLQGLRQVEVTRLNYEDLDLVSGIANIQGKGQDHKEPVYLHPETVKILKEFIAITGISSSALFTSSSNNSKGKRLTTRGIRLIVKDLLNLLNINKSTHGFRHYFTTTLIEKLGNLLEVAKFTRHKSLEMLQVYNDNIQLKASLPAYYNAFNGIGLNA